MTIRKTSHRRRRLVAVTALAALGALIVFVGAAAAAPQIDLAPAASTELVGNAVTLTATASDTGRALPDQNIVFTVTSGPNTGQSFQTVTDAKGQATFTYTSAAVGTDHITASLTSGAAPINSNDATVTWVEPQLDLAPAASTQPVGASATMTATASGAGQPLPDRTIIFTVTSGPNAGATQQAVTDPNGQATFTDASSTTGTDHVTASMFFGEAQITSNDAAVTWTVPQLDLASSSSTQSAGQAVTLTATASNAGQPLPDRTVTFTVTSGPSTGLSRQGVTDANGQAMLSYTSSTAGTDHVTASFSNAGASITSNDATVTWTLAPPPKTDVRLTVTAPSLARVGAQARWTATLTNAGPDTATGVIFHATAPAGATLASAAESRGNGCTGSTCEVGTLQAGATATVTLVYMLGQAGAATLAASVEGDYDTNPSNNAASATTTVLQPGVPPPPPPPPSQPGTFNAIPTGTVRVNGADQPADQLFVLHSGDTVDVTDGVITFTTADGSTGNFSSSQPTARRQLATAAADNITAQFTIDQPASGGTPTLTLVGGDFSVCGSKRSLAANKTPIRQLWGSAKGNFRTTARFSAATVRGTIWLVQDRCDGSVTQVVQGVVDVVDTTRNKTVSVAAGSSYEAEPRPALKVTAQTPAQVKRRGLVYGGRAYRTKAAFTKQLQAIGYTWGEFAQKYPGLAAALARRSR